MLHAHERELDMNEKLELQSHGEFCSVELSAKVIDAAIDLIKASHESALVKVGSFVAPDTNQAIVQLNPSDSLVVFCSALRAWNAQFSVVEHK